MKTLTNQWIVVMTVWSLFILLPPSPSVACECILSGETKSATIEFGGEAHCYYFWAEAGHGVVIEMADLSDAPGPHVVLTGLEPRVQLIDPNGVRVAEAGSDGLSYSRATIEGYQTRMTGIYTIVVSDADGSYYDGYNTHIERTPDTGDYGLSLVVTGGTTMCPGDRDGGDLTVGRAVNGMLSLGGDTDAYAFFGQPPQGIWIEMTDRSSAEGIVDALGGLEPRVQLYDPDGNQVADSGWGYARATIENYQLKMSGVYTIVVSDADSAYFDGWNTHIERTPDTGEYGLSVSVMPPKQPRGLYPCEPQPADGQVIDYCDPNYVVPDVVVKNEVLSDGNEVERLTGGDYLSWWSVIGATGYDVYFAGGPCLPLERIAENVADPWVPVPKIEDEQVCYWRVVAHTPAGDIQGPTWWFMARCVPPPPDGCTLTIDVVGQGSIEGTAEGINEYPCGAEVLIKAKPDPGYEFVRWEGSAADGIEDPTAPEITVIVDDHETLTAVFEEAVYDILMDVDPDWTLEGQWEYGMPTGQQRSEWGNVDPTSGCTGPNVVGVNLDGCYDLAIGGPYYATTDAIDLSGYEDVRLRFCRWLNCDIPEYVRCTVEVSTDGQHWTILWTQAEREEVTDTEWTVCEYPLAQADSQPTVYLRWGYHVLRERAYAYTGWNIDDVQLIGRRQ